MMRKVADPLPECQLCERPTRRATHERNRGLCNDCTHGIAETVRMLPVRTAPHELSDHTVNVERYRPPVPGQLPIEDQP